LKLKLWSDYLYEHKVGGWSRVGNMIPGGEEVLELKGEGIEALTVWVLTDITKNVDGVMLECHSERGPKSSQNGECDSGF